VIGGGWLEESAVLVVERSARSGELSWPESVAPVMNRRYGEGVLWYGRPQ
jgi:16S rRNA (guanine966-N2)-methyltransferase